jgi:hypothetical protein
VFLLHRGVGVATENSGSAVQARVKERARRDFFRHAQPARIEPVNQPGNRLALEIEFLKLQVKQRHQVIHAQIADNEAVKLMAVDRRMAQPLILPRIFLIDLHAN